MVRLLSVCCLPAVFRCSLGVRSWFALASAALPFTALSRLSSRFPAASGVVRVSTASRPLFDSSSTVPRLFAACSRFFWGSIIPATRSTPKTGNNLQTFICIALRLSPSRSPFLYTPQKYPCCYPVPLLWGLVPAARTVRPSRRHYTYFLAVCPAPRALLCAVLCGFCAASPSLFIPAPANGFLGLSGAFLTSWYNFSLRNTM